MNDKYKILLDQYDLHVDYLKRGRGEIICGTDQGLFALSATKLSEERLAVEHQWKEELIDQGFTKIDQYIENKEHEFISYDKYYEPFVMRRTFNGTECNIHSPSDLSSACRNLASFHRASGRIPYRADYGTPHFSLTKSYHQRRRELKSIWKYIGSRKNKGDFEYLFLQEIQPFWKQLEDSSAKMEELTGLREGWCHGSYNHHNVLIGPHGTATLHFEHFYYGYPLTDLYYFIRKALEKNEYQFSICETMLKGYSKVQRLTMNDYSFLYVLFLYPEKLWKISNQYMNHKKHWVSPRYLNKLQDIVDLKEKREKFLLQYHNFYNVF